MDVKELRPYLDEYIRMIGLKKTDRVHYECPVCGSGHRANGSGGLSVSHRGYPHWTCFACGEKGDVVDMIRHVEGLSFSEAIKRGEEMFLAGGATIKPVPVVRNTQPQSNIASIEKRDTFYRFILGGLSLSQKHISDLKARGVLDSEIGRYRSVPDRVWSNTTKGFFADLTQNAMSVLNDTPDGVPGFYVNQDGCWTFAVTYQGFLIPVMDMAGRIQGLQLRVDDPTKSAKYIWISSNPDPTRKRPYTNGTCAESVPHCRWGSRARDTLYITEGPLKGDIASTLLDRTFLALPGVTSTSTLPNILTAFKKRGVVRVVFAFDMDRATNPAVASAIEKAQSIVKKAGLECHDFIWNPNFPVDGKYKGIDDWAVSRNTHYKKG